MKICFRCKKEIEEKDNYYTIIENNLGEEVKKDYVHRTCWDKFLSQLDGANESLKKSNMLLDAMGNQMKKMGLIPEKEVIIC
jgi:hypothetical protein